MAHFQIKNLSFTYPTTAEKKSLDGVNLSIERENMWFCAASPAAVKLPSCAS